MHIINFTLHSKMIFYRFFYDCVIPENIHNPPTDGSSD